jgi:ATP-dependent helicase YprA (DUF1998 family)
MKQSYYSRLLPELAQRAKFASVSRLGFSNAALRRHLLKQFAAPFGQEGSFLANPVFEATFGWQAAGETMADLGGNLLAPALVDAMDAPPAELRDDYRFPRTATPYTHQLQAWRLLSRDEPQSVVVTSGTGSGKTECFMVPILNRLCREMQQSQRQLVGVRALFLYPLNALINSQRDRLHAWTHAFGAGIRFCLYNGNTPGKPGRHDPQLVNQVLDRETLRDSPPPILVTNATMLEYMLVRAQDAPILDKSQGTLEWIVLDEAHSYIGSQAAELALLLRRVLHGFGVRAGQVRFVATSATIGDPSGEAGKRLRSFIAGLAGVGDDQVHVVSGQRAVPSLPTADARYRDASLPVLESLAAESDDDALFAALAGNETALRLRNRFVQSSDRKPVAQLSELRAVLATSTDNDAASEVQLLRWLDLLSGAVHTLSSGRQEPFLPLRAHLFHQVLAGLWACVDPQCQCKGGTALATPEWPYGRVFLEQRRRCDCGAPVFEIHSCNECGESFLPALVEARKDADYLEPESSGDVDEFTLDIEHHEDESPDAQTDVPAMTRSKVIIANRPHSGGVLVAVDRDTLQLDCAANASPTLRLDIRWEEELTDGRQTLACPCCQATDSTSSPLSRRAILGAPFLLGQIIPTLLEFCEDGANPLNKPYRGKRMITFTDSRQGTARVAAKIQQDSERNRLRAIVLARVTRMAASSQDNATLQQHRTSAATLRAVLATADPTTKLQLQAVLANIEAQIAAASVPQPVPFSEMVEYLTTNEPDIKRMYDFYLKLDPERFDGSSGLREFARMLLAREFGRRPKRVNSSETMGLVAVRYPKLDTLTRAPIHGGIMLDEWKAFLKIALDMFVRENTCIDLPESWKKWSGNKIPRKYLLDPRTKESAVRGYIKWPQSKSSGRSPRLARLLSYALKIDPSTPDGRDTIDTLLRNAWDDLVTYGILQGNASLGYYLAFDAMAFAPIARAWICPVTRRLLDTTLRGVTPYLPREAPSEATAQCREVVLPSCPPMTGSFVSEDERIAAIRQWLATTPEIRSFREEGVWSDLNDRIIEGAAYFRSAEHSAQQPANRLAEYERQFKDGYLNLLSCSTTMEMGVDIGGISVVAMNNVPPHPANYLQRAGRAGRRSETRSVALTVCKNNPHDQAVFASTRWPFDTSLPLPGISLSSSAIVQRHVNSMLLSHFLRKRGGTASVDLNKLDCAWFFLPQGEAFIDQFCHWTENWTADAEPALAEGLTSLVRNTCFDGTTSLPVLAQLAAGEMRRVFSTWHDEYAAIEARLAEYPTAAAQKEPACKALMIQRSRLTSEYLLSELATGGFLPGYGFPTHIAALDTLNIEQLKRMKQQAGHREDNRMRHRDLPSRDLVTALREYAPGSEVVMDGMVYRSAGITLNWHSPTSQQDVREIQNIRRAWRCRSCGANGTSPNVDQTLYCTECARPLPAESIRKYLEPAGFAVDLYADIHNDVTQQHYVKPQMPWLHVNAEWSMLPNARLGRFRASPEGSAFFHSSGEHERGYAICLTCGRAEPMEQVNAAVLEKAHLPSVFRKPHLPLRGRRGGDSVLCPGSDHGFAIMPAVHLGHEVRTDVLELQLKSVDGDYLHDETVAFSLASAIRSAIAQMLGIQAEELGCSTKEVRTDGEPARRSILVYDNNAGGYVVAISDRIEEVFAKAAAVLDCKQGCDSACQHCLDDYGTRFQKELLNRHAALAFLTPEWLRNLRLPAELQFFGDGASSAEYQPLPEAIWRELSKPASSQLQIFLHGPVSDWDLPASSLRSYLYRWIAKGKPITLALQEADLNAISTQNRQMLGVLANLDQISVATCASLPRAGGGALLARLVTTDGLVAWASESVGMGHPDSLWGESQRQIVVCGRYSAAVDAPLTPVPASQLLSTASQANSYRLAVSDQWNGNLQGFGDRFWEGLLGVYRELATPFERKDNTVVSVTYRDRYLHSPLPIGLLLEVLNALKRRLDDQWQPRKIVVETVPLSQQQTAATAGRLVWLDWNNELLREEAIQAAFAYCGLDGLDFVLTQKYAAEHARTLDIVMGDGSGLTIQLDQGLSYWKANRGRQTGAGLSTYGNEFDFSAPPLEQGSAIAELRTDLVNPNYPTYLYANMR